jgi:hypothetical protein
MGEGLGMCEEFPLAMDLTVCAHHRCFRPCALACQADAVTNDEINAERLVTFLLRFLDRFPTYKGRDLYLAGESYGGHYLPASSKAILAHVAADVATNGGGAPTTPLASFRGFLVGNPYTDPSENAKGMMDAIWGHGLLPTNE